jgi:hypothetical protein
MVAAETDTHLIVEPPSTMRRGTSREPPPLRVARADHGSQCSSGFDAAGTRREDKIEFALRAHKLPLPQGVQEDGREGNRAFARLGRSIDSAAKKVHSLKADLQSLGALASSFASRMTGAASAVNMSNGSNAFTSAQPTAPSRS